MFPEETASNEHFEAPLEVLVPAKRGTASFRNVLHPLKIRGPKSVTVLDRRCVTGRVHVLQEQLVPRHSPDPPLLLDHSPPHEPVFGANQLCGVLDETALSDVATCLLLAVPINEHDARSRSPHCGRLSSTSGVVSRRQSNSFTRVAPSHPRRSIAARTSCAGAVVKTSFCNTFPALATPAIGALLYY